jgi:CRP-like cAMP-binding protein
MPLIPHPEVIQERLAALPVVTFQAGEPVFRAGARSDRLLFLKTGTVAVIKDGVEIARVTQANAVFGELSVLLDKPHTADVRAVETSQFHVATANVLAEDPFVLLYVTAILARRLDAANKVLVEVKTQLKAGQPGSLVGKTIEKMEGMLAVNVTDLALLT